jgi:hypothetical protein
MAQIAQFPGLGMYDEGGKFEVKQEFIDAARAKAIEEGKKYYGDATNFEVFRDGILNLPDSAINFVARGAEGTGELFAGLASLVMKGGQLATTTDPDKLTQIMSEPSFTKYMGAFKDKIPTPNLYESDISGMEDTEKAFGTAGYYTSPVPMAPFAKGIPYLFKAGKAAKEGTENIIKDVANVITEGDSGFRASAGNTKRFPIQMGGPEKKLIKGVNDTAEDIFSKVDQNIIDNVDITSGFKYDKGKKLSSYATPEKKKLTLKLLKIAENDKSNEVFGVKFQNAYKNYVLGEDTAIPKDYFRGGFQSYKKVAKNILSYKNQDPKILNIPNQQTVRVSPDGTKVTQLVGNTAGDPQTLWNNIKIGKPVTGDAKKRLRSEIIVGDDTKNFRAVKYEITQKDKTVSSKLSTLKNLFEESTDNTHIYSIDHIQAPRFGGANANKENLTFIMEGPHNNLKNLPTSKTLADDVVKPKSRFEDEVYKRATGLVDAVASGNIKRAEELSKEIFDLQNNFKNTFKNVDFVVGEAFTPVKTGEKTANYIKYSDEVGLNDEQKKLVENLLPTYSNRPNQGVNVEKSIDRLIDAYSQMAILTPGGKISKGAAGQMYSGKDGGMVEISHLTRPL